MRHRIGSIKKNKKNLKMMIAIDFFDIKQHSDLHRFESLWQDKDLVIILKSHTVITVLLQKICTFLNQPAFHRTPHEWLCAIFSRWIHLFSILKGIIDQRSHFFSLKMKKCFWLPHSISTHRFPINMKKKVNSTLSALSRHFPWLPDYSNQHRSSIGCWEKDESIQRACE